MLKGKKYWNWNILNDILVHIFFIILFVFSLEYYKERLFSDSSYYIFKVINFNSLWIEHNRFVLAFPQILPLMAVFAGLPLKAVLLIYSVGNVIFFYSVFLVSRYLFKDFTAGILLLLIQVIGLLWGYFVPMFELYYGAGLLVLFLSVMAFARESWFKIVFLCILEFLILTCHPVGFFLFLFAMLLYFIETGFKYSHKYLVFILIIIGTFIFKKFTVSAYEASKTQAFFDTFNNGTYDFSYLQSLWLFLFEYYKEILLIFLITVVFLALKKRFLLLVYYILSFIFFLGMVNISNYGFGHSRYQEQVYFPMIFVVVTPFCRFFQPHIKKNFLVILTVFTFLLIGSRLIQISNEGKRFSNRINTFSQLIRHCQSLEGSKFIIAEKNITNENSLDLNWSFPIETMLLSGIFADKRTVTICSDNDTVFAFFKGLINDKSFLFRTGEIFSDLSLNKKYFKLNEGPYLSLNKRSVFPVDSARFISNIKIESKVQSGKLKFGSAINLPVKIINKNQSPVSSFSDNNLFISYHWVLENKIAEVYEFHTPVMVDIFKEFSQDIIVFCPDNPGKYILSIDMLVENKKWLGLDCKQEIEVY